MDYKSVNRKQWNERTKVHFNSSFYDNKSFIAGRNSLNAIELNLLNDIAGKSILHLQCHFGQDTLSMARMGADVTGVDISDEAIDKARELSATTNIKARFIRSDVYDLPDHLEDSFDIIFTSYGTIGWLPDLDKWASVIKKFLKPGGEFIFVEFHPVVWMFSDDFKSIAYSYFNKETITEEKTTTYAGNAESMNVTSVSWNHHLGEVFGSLLRTGLKIISFEEFDYSPYNCFQNTVETEKDRYMIKGLEGKIPMIYALKGQLL